MKHHYAKKSNKGSLFILGILFFVFGFVTWLNGTLIPFLRIVCELQTDLQAFLVTFAFYIAYFVLAIPSSFILQKTGFKKGMAMGLLIMGIGAILFIPAAHSRSFSLFLLGLFIQGAGLALLQTASNPYISIIGPIESAAGRISIMGICNKTAGFLSPLFFSAILLKGATGLQEQLARSSSPDDKNLLLNELAGQVVAPYAVMALVLLLLAVGIWLSALPEINIHGSIKDIEPPTNDKKSIFQFPHLILGVLCLFLYVGAEVMSGDAIGTYGQSMGMPVSATRYFTSFTLAAMLIGYIVGIICIPRFITQQNSLRLSAILGLVFTIGVFLSHGYVAIFFIALLGLANALMWPAIFPLAITGLGKFVNIGAAMMVMGISGGALIPLLYGFLKGIPAIGNAAAFFMCLFPAYLFILYYAVSGCKKGISPKPTVDSVFYLAQENK